MSSKAKTIQVMTSNAGNEIVQALLDLMKTRQETETLVAQAKRAAAEEIAHAQLVTFSHDTAPISHYIKKDYALTPEAFNQLLDWLGPDRETAGKSYEEIRRRLIKIFTVRGCHIPEELADETFNRVGKKVAELAADYVGDPSLYFFGVAHKVFLEYLKAKHTPSLTPGKRRTPTGP